MLYIRKDSMEEEAKVEPAPVSKREVRNVSGSVSRNGNMCILQVHFDSFFQRCDHGTRAL